MNAGRFICYQSCIHLVASKRLFSATAKKFVKIAVVGSGPAGFYLSGPLLRGIAECSVDIFEKLPVPFGLIRYGVAPDHPEVKNCTHQFQDLVEKNADRCRFFGNVTVGRDISVAQLRKAYDVVCFAYGAEWEKRLGVPGEELANCFSARQFVGWYNGHPDQADLNPSFDCETAIILGHGNVALDVSRILLSPMDQLRKTDLPEIILEKLEHSKISKVITVGRRGPLQVAFAIKELREMVNLPTVSPRIIWECADNVEGILETLPRPRKRLTELLWKTFTAQESGPHYDPEKVWELKFCRTPLELISSGKTERSGVECVKFARNRLEKSTPIITDERDIVNCGLVVQSIGYRSVPIDGLPFEQEAQVVKTESAGCRVERMPGVYACGWCARGPTGVLATTQVEAKNCSKIIMEDLKKKKWLCDRRKNSGDEIEKILIENCIRWVSWEEWLQIDAAEQKLGSAKNKPREKLIRFQEMMKYLN